MFVKQIDMKTALELTARGQEVMVLIPGISDSKWEDMMPDTLQHMLDGCLFFRREVALEKELVPPPTGEKETEKPHGGKRSRSTRGSCWPFIRPDGAMLRLLTSWGSAT